MNYPSVAENMSFTNWKPQAASYSGNGRSMLVLQQVATNTNQCANDKIKKLG
jgi:hypothetical protein